MKERRQGEELQFRLMGLADNESPAAWERGRKRRNKGEELSSNAEEPKHQNWALESEESGQGPLDIF